MNKWMVVPYCASQNKNQDKVENEFLKIIKQPEQKIQNVQVQNKQILKEEPSSNEVNETNAWQEDSYITAYKDEQSFDEPLKEPSFLEESNEYMDRLRQYPTRVNEKNITKRKKKKKKNLATYLQRTVLVTPQRPAGLYDTKKNKSSKKNKPLLNTTDVNPYRINFENYDGDY